MNIVVCIKQVPASAEVRMDPETGVLLRDSAEGRLNPYDAVAIEAALRLREEGNTLTALAMGPAAAEKVLRFAWAMGADRAALLCDRAFAGADVLSTARALSQAILALGGAELVVCGRQTTDGDTAQVGPALAAFLGRPCACWVQSFARGDGGITVEQALTGGVGKAHYPLPCVLAVDKTACVPRAPSLKRKLAAGKAALETLTLSSLPDCDPAHYGLLGSATSVKRIFPPERPQRGQSIGGTLAEQAAYLAAAVRETAKEGQPWL